MWDTVASRGFSPTLTSSPSLARRRMGGGQEGCSSLTMGSDFPIASCEASTPFLCMWFPHDVGQHQEQGRAGWGGGGWCTAFCFHSHLNLDVILEEVEVCLRPRDPALRGEEHPAQLHNSGLTTSWEASSVAVLILCPGGASKAVGDDQRSGLFSFHTGRSQYPEGTRTTITQKLVAKSGLEFMSAVPAA